MTERSCTGSRSICTDMTVANARLIKRDEPGAAKAKREEERDIRKIGTLDRLRASYLRAINCIHSGLHPIADECGHCTARYLYDPVCAEHSGKWN